MKNKQFSVTGKLEIFDMYAPWTYMRILPVDVPNVITGGWGSIPIEVTIGKTTWKTSMFPLPKQEAYFIPVKKQVLKKENLKAGVKATVKYKVA